MQLIHIIQFILIFPLMLGAQNNADTTLSIGTSSTEGLFIQVLNGASNKTAEEIKFISKTADATSNYGKFTFSVDETDILEINDSGIELITFEKFEKKIKTNMDKSYILLTIDDAFESFYINAWPILKKQKIPFILFVSTREIDKYGYMTWKQIKEIAASDLVTIGNHSHSHEYLIDWSDDKIKSDLATSNEIFKKELGYLPKIFSYPFGEYSSNFKKIVSDLNFTFAFGQHSGVIDSTKDFLELPRFPINEKYGELKRFKSILQTLPFPYENITPENRYIKK